MPFCKKELKYHTIRIVLMISIVVISITFLSLGHAVNSSLSYASSNSAIQTFKLLGYDIITDYDVAKNPEIIFNYDKIILLHNEYVTKLMFDAITTHPKVIYLYPNALFAEVDVDFDKNSFTLIRGHSYPDTKITNGFDWEYDNTRPYEYDNICFFGEFYEIPNGMMLNCYPEFVIFSEKELLVAIKEF